MSNRPPPEDLVIRPARSTDVHAICELDRVTLLSKWSPEMYRSLMADRRSDVRVASIGERLIGFHVITKIHPDIELLKIGVAPEFQGTGVGMALLEDVLGKARSGGFSSCFLEVRASNNRAIRFYHKRGFEVVGVRRAYYREPTENALVMRKDFGSKTAEELFTKDRNGHE